MFTKKSFFPFLMIFLLIIGCKSNIKKIEETLSEFVSHPISIDTSDYIAFCNDSTYNTQAINEATLKYVCYIDSFECSPCILKNAYKWNDYIYKFEDYGDKISFSYIISSSNSKDIITQARESGFCQTIFIDTLKQFSLHNPHIPIESLYHVFLLDKDNNIILVGNPLNNKAIEDKFNSIVKKTLGTP